MPKTILITGAQQFNEPQAAAKDPAHCKMVMQTLNDIMKSLGKSS